MAKTHSLIDHIYYENRKDYTHVEGEVAYLDPATLRRPFEMPRYQRIIALVIVAVAVIIGFLFINNTILASIREAEQAKQAVADNMARQPSIETAPQMSQPIKLRDDEIRARFQETGFTVYDASDPEDPTNMVLYKLPSDVTLDDAAVMYMQGINSLTAPQASKLLVGSWYFNSDRSGSTSMVVRYADFSTADPQVAVQNALTKQGFNPESITESGVDDSGNTFSLGSIDVDGTMCTWKISALPLKDMYSISGLPEDACYVGVRVTA